MTAAWAAVTVAAATVAANVVGVFWASRTQRRLAQAERLGDRQIEVYLDLIKWTKKMQSLPYWNMDSKEAYDALELPADLDARVSMLADNRIREDVDKAQVAWFHVAEWIKIDRKFELIRKQAMEQNVDPQSAAAAAAKAAPERRWAMEASKRIEETVREITAPETAKASPAGRLLARAIRVRHRAVGKSH